MCETVTDCFSRNYQAHEHRWWRYESASFIPEMTEVYLTNRPVPEEFQMDSAKASARGDSPREDYPQLHWPSGGQCKYDDIIHKIERLGFASASIDLFQTRTSPVPQPEDVRPETDPASAQKDLLEVQPLPKKLPNMKRRSHSFNSTHDSLQKLEPPSEDAPKQRRHSFAALEGCNFVADAGGRGDEEEQERKEEEEEEEEEEDDDLVERGPIRPQFHFQYHQQHRAQPYSTTLDWIDSGGNLSYDSTVQELLTDVHYSERLNPCLDELSRNLGPRKGSSGSNSNSSSSVYGPNKSPVGVVESPITGAIGNAMPASGLPSIVVSDDQEEAQLLEMLSRGGYQAAQVFSDTSSNSMSSPMMKSDLWPDSPISNCNVISSRPNSRASSRAQSPGTASVNLGSPMTFANITGSPLGSPQIPTGPTRVPTALSSSSSSNQSYGDTPSPANYQQSLNQRIEEQLAEELECFNSWRSSGCTGYESSSSGTIVNTGPINAFDSTEFQLVEEVIRDLGGRYDNPEDIQVVPKMLQSQETDERKVEHQQPQTQTQTQIHSQPQLLPTGCKRAPVNGEAGLNFSSTGSIINEAHRSLVYPTFEEMLQCYSAETETEASDKSPISCCTNSPEIHEGPNRDHPLMGLGFGSEGFYPGDGAVEQHQQHQQQPNQQQFHTEKSPCEFSMLASSLPAATTFNDFQMPESVSSYKSNRSTSGSRRNSERSIVPWPTLNLPCTKASERLKEGLDPKDVEKAMKSLLKKPVEELAKADEDGDTMLMCLVGNPDELKKKKAYLVPLVERLSSLPGALSMRNNNREDALYQAAMNSPGMAYVTGYLAATFLQKGLDITQKLYNMRGDTLIHAIATKGDTHGEVLAELLALKTSQGNSVFDLSKGNYDGKTPLHVAVETHDHSGNGVQCLAITRLLLENGADGKMKETKCGDTALHMAVSLSCDPALVKTLLSTPNGKEAVNVPNYTGNTPLHLASAMSNSVSLERQMDVCWQLVHSGGQTNIPNRQGKTPLALVSTARKDAIKKIFYKKS